MTTNTSSAYDLSIYEAQPRPKQQPALQVVQKRSAKRTLSFVFTPRVLGGFAIVVTLISLMVYNQVILNELTAEINELQQEIVELNSDHVKMSSQVEAMVSLHTVAEQVRDELGMTKLDKYNTEYVNLYGQDQINLGEQAAAKAESGGVVLRIRAIIDGILEYIPGR